MNEKPSISEGKRMLLEKPRLFKTLDLNNNNNNDNNGEDTISPFIVKRHSIVTISLNDEKILFQG